LFNHPTHCDDCTIVLRQSCRIRDLDKRLDLLQQLETELGDLLKRPLDEITPEDLDEMLTQYAAVIDDATRAALQQVLADLKQSTSPPNPLSNFALRCNATWRGGIGFSGSPSPRSAESAKLERGLGGEVRLAGKS
jgi:hypothetical protein